MKHVLFFCVFTLSVESFVSAQQITDKERAEQIANEDFSKSKHRKMEKHGVAKERKKVILSQPVIRQDIQDYAVRYQVQDRDYTLDLKVTGNRIEAVLKNGIVNDNSDYSYYLKGVTINDALFKAKLTDNDGKEERIEGFL